MQVSKPLLPAPEPLLPDPLRRLAAWCALLLLVSGVVYVGIRLCDEFRTAVVPVLLALLGMALLGPLHRRLVKAGVQRSVAAGLTRVAVVAVVGGAVYILVAALIDTGDEIVASLRQAARGISEHFGAAGTSLEDLASNARGLLGRFGGSAASGVISGVSVVGETIAMAVLALLLVFFFLRDSDKAAGTLRALSPRGSADTLEAMARRAFRAVEGFMRGTTFIALIDALCVTVGLLFLDVPGAAGLGALVFVGAYIPYLGAFISGAVAVLVALADRGFVRQVKAATTRRPSRPRTRRARTRCSCPRRAGPPPRRARAVPSAPGRGRRRPAPRGCACAAGRLRRR
ncbi:AI-2E family transporter [Streptomyces coeruleorubidus]|uniref:AI-2E family transporter n=1 Tax=Streptomyces coeruleorubidus TaxID=116188 RepID=UPI00340CB960